MLLLLPQRYIFSSKSQPAMKWSAISTSCCCYHKGTYFQANHNWTRLYLQVSWVVVATTKVHIFKQITTPIRVLWCLPLLLLLPQRYIFSSKSQQHDSNTKHLYCCCCYHKGTYFQANHNIISIFLLKSIVVVATTKVHIFKQITTYLCRTIQN